MHTDRTVLPSRVSKHRPDGVFLLRLLLLLGAMLGLLNTPAAAQVGFSGAPEESGLNVRVYPLDTWSPRVGAGVGAGLVVHHLGRQHSQALLTAAPAQHEQVATVAWASANPNRARQYVLVSARGLHTNRDWFYGLGPGSSSDTRQSIERSAVQIRLRTGQHLLNRRLLVQPHVGLSAHRVDRVPAPSAPGLNTRSKTHLQQLASDPIGPLQSGHTGLRVGVDAQYDTTPQDSRSTRGLRLEAGWVRYTGFTSSVLVYDQLDLAAMGHVPLGGAHHLVGRLSLTHTVARDQGSVPYFLRPTLGGSKVPGWDRHRFVDSDRLIGSVLYRFPLARSFNVIRLDGHLGVHAASVYEDVFSNAAFDLTFEESPNLDPSSVPLRPAASIGTRIGLLFRELPALDLAVGLSPEGVTAVRFTLSQDLQALRPSHHQLRP
jgi:hypothetical protein